MPDKKRCTGLKGRRAQLTAFIIIGILVLAMAGALIYLLTSAKKSEAEKIVEKGIEATFDEAKIREYITACITKEGKDLIRNLSVRGGTLNPTAFKYYYNVKYTYHCIDQEGYGCVSRLITRKAMANELDMALPARIKECVDLENFRNQGYGIEEGEITARSTIGTNDVNLEVTYPLTISKDGQSVSLDAFSTDIISRLGMLYDLAVKITYEEARTGSFDESKWMEENGNIAIEKHKPYPDTVYSLKYSDPVTEETESFNFAIGGRYTVFDIGKPAPEKKSKGYCRMQDKNCYAQVSQGDCVKAGGEWNSGPFTVDDCTGLSTYAEQCQGDECSDCGRRKNGESWCEYEGLASPGFSPVGSRHYKGTCIDGKIYYTECRDYREEICVENDNLPVPEAICRPNRWQDCAEQTTKEKCMDNSIRDCYWSDWLVLNRQGKCIPYIPPGFMFWAYNGADACSMANEQYDCNYYTCGQSWVDSSAMYCTFMGDCGNYRNVEGELSQQGYFNLDSAPSEYTYLTEEQLKVNVKPNLRMQVTEKPELQGDEFDNPHGTVNELINNEVAYMNEVSNWEYEDFRQSYIFEGKVYLHVLQTGLCMPWQAPYKGKNCDECGGPNRPCTEYKCRSMGQTCNYEEVNGIGFCYDYAEKDNTPPVLFYDGSKFGDVVITQDIFGKIQGYKIDKPLQPYAPLFFMLNASEPVKCKPTAMPQVNYEQIPFPSPPAFNDFYVYTDMVPKPVDFRIGLMDSLGITSFLELGSYETYDTKFRQIIFDARKFVKEFDGGMDKANAEANIAKMEKMWNDDYLPMIKKLFDTFGDTLRDLSIQMQQGYKVVFFKCIDKAGNQNEKDIFLKYKIGQDSNPPYIMGALPLNNTNVSNEFGLVLSVNEPATCRYAREDMNYDAMPVSSEMECTTPIIESFTRMYECRSKMKASEGLRTELYIRCKDKPTTIKRYGFNITKKNLVAVTAEVSSEGGTTNTTTEETHSGGLSHVDPTFENVVLLMQDEKRINFTPEWAEYFTIPDAIQINSAFDEVEIVMNINEEIDCRYSHEQGTPFQQMKKMECSEGPEGIFPCKEKFDTPEDTFVEVACMKSFEEEERNAAKESQVLSWKNLAPVLPAGNQSKEQAPG